MIVLFFSLLQVKPLVITTSNNTQIIASKTDFILKQELVYKDGTNVMG